MRSGRRHCRTHATRPAHASGQALAARGDSQIIGDYPIAYRNLAAPFELGTPPHSVHIGTSIGIAVYPADGRDADTLVKAADAAMYCAKQTGDSFMFCAASGVAGINNLERTQYTEADPVPRAH